MTDTLTRQKRSWNMSRRRKQPLDSELALPETRSLWQTVGLFSDHYLKARIQKND
jgi:hypothetical protein